MVPHSWSEPAPALFCATTAKVSVRHLPALLNAPAPLKASTGMPATFLTTEEVEVEGPEMENRAKSRRIYEYIQDVNDIER